ncbi:hypothetical protein GX563_03295 [Candidatus Bathyarchaeota archaeon]|nr:hypothetical protein [Candidatus Bathyarchaeota archaeon]
MSTETAGAEIKEFFKAYVKSKNGQIAGENGEVFTVTYPDKAEAHEYTYESSVARKTKAQLITAGSPAFQQLLRECLENGAPCQIQVKPKGDMESLIRKYFKDQAFDCQSCYETSDAEPVHICVKPQRCIHRINNGKIVSVEVGKSEPQKFFLFYYSATFQNKLRAKNEEIIPIIMDEKGNTLPAEAFSEDNLLCNEALVLQDAKNKLKSEVFENLKYAADEKLSALLQQKVLLYDLPLGKEKKAKIRSFEKRLRRERREHVISKRHDFDYVKWQTSYDTLVKREEESYTTNIAVKFVNLLVINTAKVKFEVKLDNKAAITCSFTLGINQPSEVTCPICHSTFTEGYATQDGQYVCSECTRQSVDTAKVYSKKAALSLDEKLCEYIEKDGGFICTVCGKKYSKLLEFKCSHDNSSVCIYHTGTCSVCGKTFSKLNLKYTSDFQRQRCPKHTKET